MGGAASVASGKGVTYDEKGNVKKCIFCNIAQGKTLPGKEGSPEEYRKLVYEDNLVAAFRSLNIRASINFLMIPKIHIANIKTLVPEHLDLLKHMREKAQEILKFLESSGAFNILGDDVPSQPGKEGLYQFSFHIPPHNTIDHLHLHCFRLPFANKDAQIYFEEGTSHCISYEKVVIGLANKEQKKTSNFLSACASQIKGQANRVVGFNNRKRSTKKPSTVLLVRKKEGVDENPGLESTIETPQAS
mmetsp:Transcript_5204/g.7210  ORF Transcript_5204/g.7210 Transcript_5204/m.7210 type:complete len:246 (-) Transcript_5204:157-894(-)|eukprot:CAMPEP_0117746948 /NCGR_PEP_ID=MMETSP0947-20121206/8232_1 /TAXON_ID=44440 /ORGANISM="Chattonella subsalsa, Strain CCMP2191" /LENGTH=245 /DNA_ID=CAMNT_0005564333 /DNA_START=124 /DNA_END=861 /DNA_ORIENTATION=-